MDVTAHIVSNPDIMLGKPTVKGTRITVELILLKLSEGFTSSEIVEMYPTINEKDIHACLAYAAQVIQSEKVIKAA